MRNHGSDIDSPYLRREVQLNRLSDLLRFIPFLPAVVFLSPLIDAAGEDVKFLGIPTQFLWIFSVWIVSILVLRTVARAMLRASDKRNR